MDKSNKSLKSPSSFSLLSNLKKPSAFNNFDLIKSNEQINSKNNKYFSQKNAKNNKANNEDNELSSQSPSNQSMSLSQNSEKEAVNVCDIKLKIFKPVICEDDKVAKKKASCRLQDAEFYSESKKPYFLSPSMIQSAAAVKNSNDKNVQEKDLLKDVPEKDLLKEEKFALKNENKLVSKNKKPFEEPEDSLALKENNIEFAIIRHESFALDNDFAILKKENTKLIQEMITLKNENDQAKKEINCLQKNIEKMERDHFQEIKSMYEKYIVLQNDKDNEKKDFVKKVSKLEQLLCEKNEEFYTQQCLVIQQEENMSKLQSKNIALDEKLKSVIESHNQEILLLAKEKDKIITEIFQNKNEIELLRNELATTKEDFNNTEKKIIEKDEVLENLNKCHNDIMDKKNSELTEEREQTNRLKAELKTKVEIIFDLEKQLTECKLESLKGADKAQSLKNEIFLQNQEINQLQQTCKVLQSTNELLNVRLNALNEILRLQEVNMTSAGSSEDKILNLWRNKVYSLLVQLKLNDIN
ncbi:repetitive organellar protein [Hydra vulgaris]|uniref:repetitive organellar protein n=1 Tax=Hydra vulgaris TaxID=6087 RepID=UPI001F5FB490|nr:repetitive organellar protein [Hydra vulgaris]